EASAGYAPAPGVRRIISGSELARIAVKNGLAAGDFADVCFERPMHLLQPAELIEAMQKSLSIPNARIEVTDFSHYSVPAGELIFPRSGLTKPDAPWSGYIAYAPNRRFTIWVRVKIVAPITRVI